MSCKRFISVKNEKLGVLQSLQRFYHILKKSNFLKEFTNFDDFVAPNLQFLNNCALIPYFLY